MKTQASAPSAVNAASVNTLQPLINRAYYHLRSARTDCNRQLKTLRQILTVGKKEKENCLKVTVLNSTEDARTCLREDGCKGEWTTKKDMERTELLGSARAALNLNV